MKWVGKKLGTYDRSRESNSSKTLDTNAQKESILNYSSWVFTNTLHCTSTICFSALTGGGVCTG